MDKASQQVKDLEDKAQIVQDRAVNAVVDRIESHIKNLEEQRNDIIGDLAKIKAEDVPKLRTEVAALQSSVQKVTDDAHDARETLTNGAADLSRVGELTAQINKFEMALAEALQARDSTVEASQKADAARDSALAAEEEATRARRDLAERTKSLSTDIDAEQRALGAAQERLKGLGADTEKTSAQVKGTDRGRQAHRGAIEGTAASS
jgi:chromosome segregation ATPase